MVYQQMSINFAGIFWKFSYILSLHKEKGFRHVSEVFFIYYIIILNIQDFSYGIFRESICKSSADSASS